MSRTSLSPEFSSFFASSMHNSMQTPMQLMATSVTPSMSHAGRMIPLSLLTSTHGALFQSKQKQVKKTLKRKAPRRKKWTKPKDKPKRPLSAYNLFFKDERELKAKFQPDLKLGFAEMGRMVAGKWRNLPKDKRAHYDAGAKKERDKYFEKLALWKTLQEKKQDNEEFDCQMESFYDSFSADSDDHVAFGLDDKTQNVATRNTFDHDEKTRDFLATKLQMALDRSVELDPNLGKGYLSDDISTVSDCNLEQEEEKVSTVRFKEEEKESQAQESPHPCCSKYGCHDCPTMKRILKTFQVLEHTIDDEFLDFMSTLDWDKGATHDTVVKVKTEP